MLSLGIKNGRSICRGRSGRGAFKSFSVKVLVNVRIEVRVKIVVTKAMGDPRIVDVVVGRLRSEQY